MTEAKRRISSTEYAEETKAYKTEKNDYLFYLIGSSGYTDWAKAQYEDILTEYAAATPEEKQKMETNKRVGKVTEKGVTNIVPLQQFGKTVRNLPKQSYMGTALAIGMPSESYQKAIKEGENSPLWSELKPIAINLSGEEFGPEAKCYVNFESGKFYCASLSTERGMKIKSGDKQYYLYEGTVNVVKEKIKVNEVGEDGKEVEVEKEKETIYYTGPRAIQYNLKLVPWKEKEAPTIKEILPSEFNITADFLVKNAFETWFIGKVKKDDKGNDMYIDGLMKLPEYFSKNCISTKKGAWNSITPISFEADVNETKINEPNEQNKSTKVTASMKLDDSLDEKKIKDGEFDFRDLTCYGPEMTPELIKLYKTFAQGSRVRVICTVSRSNQKSRLTGKLLHVEAIKSTSLPDTLSSNAAWDIEDDNVEESVEESEPKASFEVENEEAK